jgi:hypothetical protein
MNLIETEEEKKEDKEDKEPLLNVVKTVVLSKH